MKILLAGCEGQLAYDIQRAYAGHEIIGIDVHNLDITDTARCLAVARETRPDLIINSAAFTNVNLSEREPLKAFAVNCGGGLNLALAAREIGVPCVYVGTDYVFGGDESRKIPYLETDPPHPVNVYGMSKLAGEIAVRNACEQHFIIRSCGLFGIRTAAAKGYTFPELMLRLAKERPAVRVVDDQFVSPTYTLDLAEKMKQIVEKGVFGTYHVTNAGQWTWYSFTRLLYSLAGVETKLIPITSREYPTPARRPGYSIMENKALENLGVAPMRSLEEALRAFLKEKGIA